jgi:methyltransferase
MRTAGNLLPCDAETRRKHDRATMNLALAVLIFVTAQRFAEFIWDWDNTRRLRAAGGVEFGGMHYPAMILVHAGWLAGLWVLGYDRPVIPAYLIAFLLLQIGRYWVLVTLGRRWTTRVIVLPGAPLIESGPYRLMRHPNYAVVAGELVFVPLALGLPLYALVSLVLYAGAALLRIQVENSALATGSPLRTERVAVGSEDSTSGRESARAGRALSIEVQR